LFEVNISRIEPFRNLVKALSVIVDEGTFNIDEAQMKLLAMDPSHVAMVDFELPSEFFDKYVCEGSTRLSINVGEFQKFLDRVDKDENVTIKLEEDKARLVIHCRRGGHKRRFVMPILEPMDEEVPQEYAKEENEWLQTLEDFRREVKLTKLYAKTWNLN